MRLIRPTLFMRPSALGWYDLVFPHSYRKNDWKGGGVPGWGDVRTIDDRTQVGALLDNGSTPLRVGKALSFTPGRASSR
jgi:hypothetical protein